MRVLVYAREIDCNGADVIAQQRQEGNDAFLRNADYFDGSITKCDQVIIVLPVSRPDEIEAAYIRKGIPVQHFVGNHFAPPTAPAPSLEPSLADEGVAMPAERVEPELEAMSETELRNKAYELLMEGCTARQVGSLLGISYQRVGKLPFTAVQQKALKKRNGR